MHKLEQIKGQIVALCVVLVCLVYCIGVVLIVASPAIVVVWHLLHAPELRTANPDSTAKPTIKGY